MSAADPERDDSPGYRFELIDVDKLRCHEELQPDLLEHVLSDIQAEGAVHRPILVAEKSLVILDGHHRYAALKLLGCRRIPCYVVDYFAAVVELTLWPTATVDFVTKEEVVRRGTAGRLFTAKTTRHKVHLVLPERRIPLRDLM